MLKSLGVRVIDCRSNGDLFYEDVTADNLRFNSTQNVWARQLNVENEGTHITSNGGNFWALGYKTERGGTLVVTREGGQSEILGGFSYTTTAGKLAPMFVTEHSAVFTYFTEVCYTGDPFATIIRETKDGETKSIERSQGSSAPYSSSTKNRTRSN